MNGPISRRAAGAPASLSANPPPGPPRAPGAPAGTPRNISARGLSYWEGDATTGPRLLMMVGTYLFSVDAATGKASAGFGTDGMVDTGQAFGGVEVRAHRRMDVWTGVVDQGEQCDGE